MSHLEETLPSNSTTDFDANLQRSIIMMQELNTEMSKDVTILYSASDMPTDKETGDKINPKWLKDDLEKAGHSCWFNSDMRTVGINEMTLALKNCKVVLALISDNFERDEKCRDLLLYTIDGLTKQYVIAPIGNSLAWFKTDLGMRIGQQEQMIMIKSKQRYAEKIPELKEAIADKLAGIVKTELKDHPECFLSYCWANSHDAVEKGSKKIKGALGDYDPRAIKKYLAEKGINVWLDYEQTTVNRGLYDNISKGLRHAKVVVACVSDEYVNSKNCMMELRFAVLTLNLPIVLAIVGTGREWKVSEVGILQQRSNSAKVYLQKQNESALDTLCSFVKERLPTAAEKLQSEALKVKKDITEIHQQVAKQQKNNVSYQEERELVQRKFMRHIISFISRMDQTPMPRLIVLDIEKTTASTGKGRKQKRPITARKTTREKTQINTDVDKEIDIDDIWDEDGLCIKMMCEYEEGWHVCDKSYHFKRSDSAKEQLKNMSPYLGRLYAIARQSHINLTCISNTCNNGEKFVSWVEQESKDHTDFVQGFQTLRSILIEDNSDQMIAFLDQLVRCHLPSGKIYWLCEKHQKMPRITKLSTGTGGSSETFKNLYQEDILLKEYMEKSDIYKQKKSQISKTPKVVLPSLTDPENRSASKPEPKEEQNVDKKASKTTDKKTKDVKSETSKEKDSVKTKDATAESPKEKEPVKRTKSKIGFKAASDVAEITNAATKSTSANDKNSGKNSATATEKSSKTCTVQ
ncbi:uncharacterized protein LOC130014108 [Patella vulgata]|uniref:uncharacterized protein LOC130014108 n=1 Tax=Patella vulgata TaxID=6465 RepID=UPI0024A91ECE|nr:uncharacterized protein LOC130014108 [Patella vulgata]